MYIAPCFFFPLPVNLNLNVNVNVNANVTGAQKSHEEGEAEECSCRTGVFPVTMESWPGEYSRFICKSFVTILQRPEGKVVRNASPFLPGNEMALNLPASQPGGSLPFRASFRCGIFGGSITTLVPVVSNVISFPPTCTCAVIQYDLP